jgi:hypothetical protein
LEAAIPPSAKVDGSSPNFSMDRKGLIMFTYKVGYHSYEESAYAEYSHALKLNAKDLEAIIEDCLFAVMEMAADDKLTKYPLFVSDDGPPFQEIMGSDEFDGELKKRGFVPVEYQERFSAFGWKSAIEPKSWNHDNTDDKNSQLTQRLKDRCEKAGIVITTKTGDTCTGKDAQGNNVYGKYEYTGLARKEKKGG